MTQPDLPFQRHSATSKAAAVKMRGSGKVEQDKAAIRDAIRIHGALADVEIQQITGIQPSSERPRRISMTKSEIQAVMQDGKQVKRRINGNWHGLWELAK